LLSVFSIPTVDTWQRIDCLGVWCLCFSAAASFGLGAALLPAGIYCSWVAIPKRWALLPLAVIPLGFGVQQCSEGFVWLGLSSSNDTVVHLSSRLFLFFALAFWPLWVPFSAWCMEPRRWARRYLSVITALGLLIGAALYFPVLMHPEWVSASRVQHSIQYSISGSPTWDAFPWAIVQVAYLAVVAIPLFVSTVRGFTVFGSIVVASALISFLFYHYAFASVWCFFAAIVSTYLCYFFRKVQAAR
jgi:hypothetical protein